MSQRLGKRLLNLKLIIQVRFRAVLSVPFPHVTAEAHNRLFCFSAFRNVCIDQAGPGLLPVELSSADLSSHC